MPVVVVYCLVNYYLNFQVINWLEFFFSTQIHRIFGVFMADIVVHSVNEELN